MYFPRHAILGGLVLVVCAAVLGAQQQGPAQDAPGGEPWGMRTAEPEAPTAGRSSETNTRAVVPRLIKFSGVVRDLAGKPLTGPVDVSFLLYKEEAGGEPLWFETQTVQADAQGRYIVLLGAMHETGLPAELFTSGEAHWLGVQVGLEAEQPRVLLVSVPYALKAGDAETLGGKPASAFLLAEFNEASGAGAEQTNTSQGGKMSGKGASQQKVATSSVAPAAVSTTANFIPMFADNLGTLTDSVMAQSGTSIVLGTISPAAPLHIGITQVYRNLSVSSLQTGAFPGVMLENTTTNTQVQLQENNGLRVFTHSGAGDFAVFDERLAVTTAGNVGIGTPSPGAKLEVAGNVIVSAGGVIIGNGSGLSNVAAATAATATNALALGGLAPSAYAPATGSTAYVAKAGDTMTGTLNLPANGLVAGTNQLSLSGGNVGIGTTAPGGLLEVSKSQNAGTVVRITNADNIGSVAYSSLRFYQGATLRAGINSINDGLVGAVGGPGAMQIWNTANGNMVFGTNNTEKVRITSAGNVGIGTPNPGAKLEVAGNVIVSAGGVITGNGSGLTNLNASNLSSGTVGGTQLSGTYTNAVTFNNASNSFTGNGAGLTNLNASNLSSGTVAVGRLPSLAGDVAGTMSSTVVGRINGTALGSLASVTNGQALVFNSSLSQWQPGNVVSLTAGDGRYAQLGSASLYVNNTYYGNQTVNGLVSASGYGSGLATVQGVSGAGSGYAVQGVNTSSTGNAYGVYGSSSSTTGIGVYGTSSGTTGFGVRGTSSGATGYGVYGNNSATTGNAYGVYGSSISSAGSIGVYGTGFFAGVKGESSSTYGVYGSAPTGVYGTSATIFGYGVYGTNTSNYGTGVFGSGRNGVNGTSSSSDGIGVYGANSATTGSAIGVNGISTSPAGIGVYGYNGRSDGGYGVYGRSDSSAGYGVYGYNPLGGYAGYFNGPVYVTGNLTSLTVGIGTPTPGAPLDVVGDIRASGKVTGGGLVVDSSTLVVDATNNRVGVGTSAPARPLQVATGDVYVSGSGSGIILRSPNGSVCRRITIDNTGALVSTAIACP